MSFHHTGNDVLQSINIDASNIRHLRQILHHRQRRPIKIQAQQQVWLLIQPPPESTASQLRGGTGSVPRRTHAQLVC